MTKCTNPPRIPLPADWSQHARSAVLVQGFLRRPLAAVAARLLTGLQLVRLVIPDVGIAPLDVEDGGRE